MLNILTPRIRKIYLSTVPFAKAEWSPLQVNHIYGENGTGKTTLANLLSGGEDVTWEDGFSSSDVQILCYDRQYVERFFRMEDRIPGIFSTQGIDRDALERIRDLRGQVEEKKLAVSGCENELRNLEDSQAAAFDLLKKSCWKGAAGFRKEYSAALRGGLSNSEKFTKKLLGILEAGRRSSGGSAAREELQSVYASAFMKEAPVYSHLVYPSAANAYRTLPGAELLPKPIMSSTEDSYTSFIHSLHASDWVHTGKETYLEKADGTCPFCGQPLPSSFADSLHKLFDDAFRAQMSALRSYEYAFKAEMNRIYPAFSSWRKHPFPEIAADGRIAALLEELKQRITEAVNRIHDKILRPTICVEAPDLEAILGKLQAQADRFNRLIDQHNRIAQDQKSEQGLCRQMAWQILAQEFEPSLRSYMDIVRKNDEKRAQICQRQEKLVSEKAALEDMIRQQESRTQNSREAVDAINRILSAARYQGFSLRERPGTEGIYEIVRPDGSLANSLSDGEYDMLTFLYFFQQAIRKGGWDESPQGAALPRVLILDDPTSGMDGRGRKIVASLVTQLADQCLSGAPASPEGPVISQIFQFTHDLAYFRSCMDMRKDNEATGEAWIQLRKREGVTTLEIRGEDEAGGKR